MPIPREPASTDDASQQADLENKFNTVSFRGVLRERRGRSQRKRCLSMINGHMYDLAVSALPFSLTNTSILVYVLYNYTYTLTFRRCHEILFAYS